MTTDKTCPIIYLKICLHKVKHKTDVRFVTKHINKLEEEKKYSNHINFVITTDYFNVFISKMSIICRKNSVRITYSNDIGMSQFLQKLDFTQCSSVNSCEGQISISASCPQLGLLGVRTCTSHYSSSQKQFQLRESGARSITRHMGHSGKIHFSVCLFPECPTCRIINY